MSASLLCSARSSPSLVSHVPAGLTNDYGEDALRRLREFLSAIGVNAAAGDLRSASLSLSCLGEPPAPKQIETGAALPTALAAGEPSPINAMVMKLRNARLAREQKRSSQTTESKEIAVSSISQTAVPPEFNFGIPEVYQVTPKQPRDLRQEAMLRLFDQSRLKRWWEWHDRQMELLKQEKLQKQRRRQFLSNLRTHAWINSEEEPVEQIKRRKHRAHSLSKLRTDLPAPLSESTLNNPASQPTDKDVAHALTQRRDSISKLKARSPLTPTSAKTFDFPILERICSRTAEDHRRRLVGEHTGSLEVQEVDYWTQWDAKELLVEQRETLRTHLDNVLSHASINSNARKPRNLKRMHAQRLFLDEDSSW
ncbi:hypothetical protein DFJ77DRAFT_507285 [Powellomyces hirtus]|nr:hypothetical protein DFJ77DRAFT_507285 [Powellomyces hirtus]